MSSRDAFFLSGAWFGKRIWQKNERISQKKNAEGVKRESSGDERRHRDKTSDCSHKVSSSISGKVKRNPL